MSLQTALEAEIARRSLGANKTTVFSVFNIGTGHTQSEINNTIAALGKSCSGAKVINDGPTGLLGNLQGWGMNDATRQTLEAIKRARPSHVNMTGHSRGAITCHMLAHALYNDPETRGRIKINIIVLDPVHQSKMTHAGSEMLDDNPDLLSYHSIIMENEDRKLGGARLFPFKFVEASAATRRKMHYINMPGIHGSGCQTLSSPIGKVVFELIAGFMRARRTEFTQGPRTPMEMCELFAEIHNLNPSKIAGERLLFNDAGNARTHNGNGLHQGVHSTKVRAADVEKALALNRETVWRPGAKALPAMPVSSYLFNQEHAFYLKACFPYLFKLLSEPVAGVDQPLLDREIERMRSRAPLERALPLLVRNIMTLQGR